MSKCAGRFLDFAVVMVGLLRAWSSSSLGLSISEYAGLRFFGFAVAVVLQCGWSSSWHTGSSVSECGGHFLDFAVVAVVGLRLASHQSRSGRQHLSVQGVSSISLPRTALCPHKLGDCAPFVYLQCNPLPYPQ